MNKLLFNAFLRSDHVIQNVEVSPEYDTIHKGYPITIKGMDAGDLPLFVTLNWIYPFSDLQTSDPTPILVSSHLNHGVSVCDFERSEIMDSHKIVIRVNEPAGGPTYMTPDVPVRCTSSMEEGRWLNVIPIGTSCRAPYCTGDRISSFVSSMSW